MAIANNVKTKKYLSLGFGENQASTQGKSGTLRCSIMALGETSASRLAYSASPDRVRRLAVFPGAAVGLRYYRSALADPDQPVGFTNLCYR
jgi:hypothetical protein